MDIEANCDYCDSFKCEGCRDRHTGIYRNFEPMKIVVELHGKLRKAVEAIEDHRVNLVTTEENAKIYMRTYPNCATTKLWKVLEELQ